MSLTGETSHEYTRHQAGCNYIDRAEHHQETRQLLSMDWEHPVPISDILIDLSDTDEIIGPLDRKSSRTISQKLYAEKFPLPRTIRAYDGIINPHARDNRRDSEKAINFSRAIIDLLVDLNLPYSVTVGQPLKNGNIGSYALGIDSDKPKTIIVGNTVKRATYIIHGSLNMAEQLFPLTPQQLSFLLPTGLVEPIIMRNQSGWPETVKNGMRRNNVDDFDVDNYLAEVNFLSIQPGELTAADIFKKYGINYFRLQQLLSDSMDQYVKQKDLDPEENNTLWRVNKEGYLVRCYPPEILEILEAMDPALLVEKFDRTKWKTAMYIWSELKKLGIKIKKETVDKKIDELLDFVLCDREGDRTNYIKMGRTSAGVSQIFEISVADKLIEIIAADYQKYSELAKSPEKTKYATFKEIVMVLRDQHSIKISDRAFKIVFVQCIDEHPELVKKFWSYRHRLEDFYHTDLIPYIIEKLKI